MRPLFLLLCFACFSCQTSSSKETQTIPPPKADTLTREIIVSLTPPPLPKIDYDSSKWADIQLLDSSIILDIKYASSDNFVKEQLYECGRCFLRPEVAQVILKIHKELQKEQLGLKMFDCFRPQPIQWKLWEKVPDPRYVTDPRKGSMHNRGAAVDLTLIDEKGQELQMGTAYDYFGREAYHTYANHPDSVLNNRLKLKNLMEMNGFKSIRTEWWHYSYIRKQYPLSDMMWNCEGTSK